MEGKIRLTKSRRSSRTPAWKKLQMMRAILSPTAVKTKRRTVREREKQQAHFLQSCVSHQVAATDTSANLPGNTRCMHFLILYAKCGNMEDFGETV